MERAFRSACMLVAVGFTALTTDDSTGGEPYAVVEANGASSQPAFSADGDRIAFTSHASNLVDGDDNGQADVFVRDLRTGAITRISVDENGRPFAGASQWPSFGTSDEDVVFVAPRKAPTTDDIHLDLYISDGTHTERFGLFEEDLDGSIVSPAKRADAPLAFVSDASNIDPPDRNGVSDVFLAWSTRISRAFDGSDADGDSRDPAVASGGKVAFVSRATDLVAGDRNGFDDVFLHTGFGEALVRASVASDGTEANGHSDRPSVDSLGRVAFASGASNLVPDDRNEAWDVFLHDPRSGETVRLSLGGEGTEANDQSGAPALSADGRWLAYSTFATNINGEDTDPFEDVLLRDLTTGSTVRISRPMPGRMHDGDSSGAVFSNDGRMIAFASDSSALVPGDSNGVADVFLYDIGTRSIVRVSERPAGR
jgi:hypothetical protein